MDFQNIPEENFKNKYLKYKIKYENLKNQKGDDSNIFTLEDEDTFTLEDENTFTDLINPYWDLFYSNINDGKETDSYRYSDVQFIPLNEMKNLL